MKHQGKKAQMTFFIIVGVFFLLGIGFFIYVSTHGKTEGKDAVTPVETAKSAIDKTMIQSFIQSCFEDMTDKALELFGKQGGYIYKEQGGIDDDLTDNYEGVYFVYYDSCGKSECMVPYWITRSMMGGCTDDFSSCPNVPDYPWKKFPYKDLDNSGGLTLGELSFDSPVFGRVIVPHLYEKDGAGSIEGKLKAYIMNNMGACLGDYKQLSHTYDIKEMGVTSDLAMNVSVLLTKNDFRVYLDYPVEFSDGNDKVRFDKFTYKVNVRLKRLYDAIIEMIKRETMDPAFNITIDGPLYLNQDDDDSSGRYLLGKDSATVSVADGEDRYLEGEEPYADGEIAGYYFDDIIEVVDKKSTVGNKPYVWRFVRQNRAPALYYVSELDEMNGKQWGKGIDGSIVASTTTDDAFEQIWLDPVGGSSFTGLQFHISGTTTNGNIIEFHREDKDGRQRAVIFMPKDTSTHINADIIKATKNPCPPITWPTGYVPMAVTSPSVGPGVAGTGTGTTPGAAGTTMNGCDLYHETRSMWIKDVFKESPSTDYIYRYVLQAIDPDEDEVEFSIDGRNVNTKFDEARGYELEQKDCCKGGPVMRVTASDGSLEDYQDIKFAIDQQKTGSGTVCGYPSAVQCDDMTEQGPLQMVISPSGSSKKKLNVVFVALNYPESTVLSNPNSEFNRLADSLYALIDESYNAVYDIERRKLTMGIQTACYNGSLAFSWVASKLNQFVASKVNGGPDYYGVVVIDSNKKNDYASFCNCDQNFGAKTFVVRTDNNDDFCLAGKKDITDLWSLIKATAALP